MHRFRLSCSHCLRVVDLLRPERSRAYTLRVLAGSKSGLTSSGRGLAVTPGSPWIVCNPWPLRGEPREGKTRQWTRQSLRGACGSLSVARTLSVAFGFIPNVKLLSLATQSVVILGMHCATRPPYKPALFEKRPGWGLICRACDTRNLIAAVRHSMSASSWNGLPRKPTAPLASARVRCFSFG